MQRDDLIHRPQIVVAIGAKGSDVQAEIDLGKRTNRDRHEGRIVSDSRSGGVFELSPALHNSENARTELILGRATRIAISGIKTNYAH
jgi:hypothetical protein